MEEAAGRVLQASFGKLEIQIRVRTVKYSLTRIGAKSRRSRASWQRKRVRTILVYVRAELLQAGLTEEPPNQASKCRHETNVKRVKDRRRSWPPEKASDYSYSRSQSLNLKPEELAVRMLKHPPCCRCCQSRVRLGAGTPSFHKRGFVLERSRRADGADKAHFSSS